MIDRLRYTNQLKKIKKELFKENCENCFKKVDFFQSILDHRIPISLGGKIIKKENLQILCKQCHKKKTNRERKIKSLIKKIKESKKQLNKLGFKFDKDEF